METITVNADNLFQIIAALNSTHGHRIRELQHTRSIEDNPINKLIGEWNNAVKEHEAKTDN